MASTTTSTATETVYAKIITDVLIDAVYSVQVMDQLMRQESLVGQPSNTYSFPVWPSLTAASIAETADLTSTAVDTTNVDISVSEAAAIRIDVTDLLTESSLLRSGTQFAAQGAKAVADKRDADAAALLGGFSTVRGGATAFDDDRFLSAIIDLQSADAPKPYAFVGYPKQVGEFRNDIVASQASVLTNRSDAEFGPGNAGFEFEYLSIPVFATSNVPSADAGATSAGAMFSVGQALARVDKRPIRMEPQRDASLRATEFNITSVYGQGELVDSWGVTVKSTR